jgi:dTDP-4-amino-4,6-dideoxygalactose transaminase
MIKGKEPMQIREDFLPLSRPSIGQQEIEAVVNCMKSGWITSGPICAAFEDAFRNLTGTTHAVAVSSATAGMHLVLKELHLQEGDEIITPSLTFASTVNMIHLQGAKPVFVDIHADTLNINVDLIEEKITSRTRAIIPVHYAGAPADLDPIYALSRKYGLKVIEDAAHAAGTHYKGQQVGGVAQGIAIFSFHPLKNITSGEGGMITFSEEDWNDRLRRGRFHGIERDAWKRYGKGANPDYDIHEPGFKYNLPDMQAALGMAQLVRLEELNRRRQELVRIYIEALCDVDGIELPGIPLYDHQHAWHLFIVKVLQMDRNLFMERLSHYNIGYGLHFPATHRLSYVMKKHGSNSGTLPQTERVMGKIISLPLYPDMTADDVRYVSAAIREILSGR